MAALSDGPRSTSSKFFWSMLRDGRAVRVRVSFPAEPRTTGCSNRNARLVPLVDELALVLLLDQAADLLAVAGVGERLDGLLDGDCSVKRDTEQRGGISTRKRGGERAAR